MAQILLHIGFPKSASTYLQKWFEEHPSIYFQSESMANGFYDAWELAKYVQYNDHVPQNFVVSCEELTLWQSEPYLYGLRGTKPYDYHQFCDRMCKMLHGIYPTAKVLIITRGYEGLFTSIYSQYLAKAGSFTFSELMENSKEMFVNMLDYGYIIGLYRKAFGAENVVILPYELLLNDPSRFLGLIEQEMEIKEKFEPLVGRANASYDNKTLAAYHALSFFIFRLLKPFPAMWQKKIYVQYMRVLKKKKPHPFLLWLSKFIKKENSMDGMEDMLKAMKGKAGILRNEELFQPYLKDYLLD